MQQTKNSPFQMKSKILLVSVLALACILVFYSVYNSLVSSRRLLRTEDVNALLSEHQTWKNKKFVSIPEAVEQKQKTMEVKARTVKLKVNSKDISVHCEEAKPVSSEAGDLSVLFLHGQGSSSQIWKKTDTLKMVAALGLRAVAIDLPGSGSGQSSTTKVDKVEFLKQFTKHEGLSRPVIVAPSMSGGWALPYLMETPENCHKRARGFVPLAPVATGKYTPSQYHQCKVPTMIVYGTKDKSLGIGSAWNLRNMANSERMPMQGLGHACYEQKPAQWRHLLYNFLLAMERGGDRS